MCLVVVAWRSHPRYPLVIAGNRDEFHARPAAPAYFWEDAPKLLAGRDLSAGGTWLGITRDGRYAVITNHRSPYARRGASFERSRGLLVTDYLLGGKSPRRFGAELEPAELEYAGFNLLYGRVHGKGSGLYYHSNRSMAVGELDPGIHGLSNALLDTPWPKLVRVKKRFAALLEDDEPDIEALLEMLADTRPAPDEALPESRLPEPVRRALSAPFIRGEEYGTRCSTVIAVDRDGVTQFVERRFDRDAGHLGDERYEFSV